MSKPLKTTRGRQPVVLAIGGLDPSGGAGLLADAATIAARGGRALGVATAITVQSSRSVDRVHPLPPALVVAQIDKLFDEEPDEAPIRAVKLGMLANLEIARALARCLSRRLEARPLVVDPVLVASSGARLFRGDAARAYAPLFALARVMTPNLAEAEALLGDSGGADLPARRRAANALADRFGCGVVLKGGHASRDAHDLLAASPRPIHVLRGTRVRGTKRGTGCRFAAALATELARGASLLTAARAAKAQVRGYLVRG